MASTSMAKMGNHNAKIYVDMLMKLLIHDINQTYVKLICVDKKYPA